MMEVLVASHPVRRSRAPAFAMSAVAHVLTLGLVISVSRAPVHISTRPVVDTTMVFLPRLAPLSVEKPPPRLMGAGGGGGGSGEGLIVSANPPPRGFQTIGIVTVVPPDIPPVAAGERALDPRDYTGRGVEGGAGWGVVGGTGPADQIPPGDTEVRDRLYDVLTADARFQPAELLVQPVFASPRILTEAGISGRVMLQFIIDTAGKIEPTSIKILTASHRAYGDAARDGVQSALFRPAQYGERPVRQLTKWPVSFKVIPGEQVGG